MELACVSLATMLLAGGAGVQPVVTDDTDVAAVPEPDADVDSAAGSPIPDPPISDPNGTTVLDVPIDACLGAHENAQLAREHADLVGARELLRTCSSETCPLLVTRDCVAWLFEVERMIPSVVFDVLVDGRAGVAEALFIDGEPVVPTGPELVVELNPGLHRFGARKFIDGVPVLVEIELVVQAASRRQVVRLELARAPVRPPRPVIAAIPPERASDRARPLRRSGLALLGVGTATGTATLIAGTLGLVAHARARDACAPFCSPARLAPIRAELLAADVLGAVTAATAIGTAVLLGLAAERSRRGRRAARRRSLVTF